MFYSGQDFQLASLTLVLITFALLWLHILCHHCRCPVSPDAGSFLHGAPSKRHQPKLFVERWSVGWILWTKSPTSFPFFLDTHSLYPQDTWSFCDVWPTWYWRWFNVTKLNTSCAQCGYNLTWLDIIDKSNNKNILLYWSTCTAMSYQWEC